jgi:hypothetical protein
VTTSYRSPGVIEYTTATLPCLSMLSFSKRMPIFSATRREARFWGCIHEMTRWRPRASKA